MVDNTPAADGWLTLVDAAAQLGLPIDAMRGAGFADRLEVAIQANGPSAVSVAEHRSVHLAAEARHLHCGGAVLNCGSFVVSEWDPRQHPLQITLGLQQHVVLRTST
jgi:hypothetical protein